MLRPRLMSCTTLKSHWVRACHSVLVCVPWNAEPVSYAGSMDLFSRGNSLRTSASSVQSELSGAEYVDPNTDADGPWLGEPS